MRIVIDLQGAQTESRYRGIGRYTIALTKEIIKQGVEHEIILVLNDSFPETIMPLRRLFGSMLPIDNIHVWTTPNWAIEVDRASTRRRRYAEFIYECFVASLQPDMLLVTSLFEGMEGKFAATIKATPLNIPTAVICYDFIPLHYPEFYIPDRSYSNTLYMENLEKLGRADLLLTLSEFVSLEAAEHLPDAQREIVNIGAACDDIFKKTEFFPTQNDELRRQLKITKDYIITSGSIEPQKNLQFLFKAFAGIPYNLRKSYQIVLTGKQNLKSLKELRQQAKNAGLKTIDFVSSGFLSNEDLVRLYSDARLMVFPSLDEGFGLPPLEAMSCGTPALVARTASLPEVAGIAEAMFDPQDHEALADQMARALSDVKYRRILIENAERQAATFSWEKTAQSALEAMKAFNDRGMRLPPPSSEQAFEMCLQILATHLPERKEIDDLSIVLAMVFPDPKQKRRLFVDVSTIIGFDALTGCQRVTRSILMAWMKNPPTDVDVMPIYAVPNEAVFFHAREYVSKLAGCPADGPDLPIDFAPGDVFFGLDLHAHVTEHQAAFLSQMHRFGVHVFFMVYDLLPLDMPEFFPSGTREAFNRWVEIISRYDGIIAISDVSADAVKTWQVKNRQNGLLSNFEYHAVHLGGDIENSIHSKGVPDTAKSVYAAMEERPCFLMTGTLEPRKGHSHVLDAFDLLWALGHNVSLMIVGKKGWMIDEFAERLVKHSEMGIRLFWLEGISDEYLEEVYARATCLIAASWGEGFGLPLIEAAHHGIPIIARDLPIFREVAGDHAFYFDAQTGEGLAASIAAWLELYSERNAPQSKGMPVLTWTESAKMIADILLKQPNPKG